MFPIHLHKPFYIEKKKYYSKRSLFLDEFPSNNNPNPNKKFFYGLLLLTSYYLYCKIKN
jgi:hypothetical protein